MLMQLPELKTTWMKRRGAARRFGCIQWIHFKCTTGTKCVKFYAHMIRLVWRIVANDGFPTYCMLFVVWIQNCFWISRFLSIHHYDWSRNGYTAWCRGPTRSQIVTQDYCSSSQAYIEQAGDRADWYIVLRHNHGLNIHAKHRSIAYLWTIVYDIWYQIHERKNVEGPTISLWLVCH